VPGEARVEPQAPQLPAPISPQQQKINAGILGAFLQNPQTGFKAAEIKQMALQSLLEPRPNDPSALRVQRAPATTAADRAFSLEQKEKNLADRKVALQAVSVRLFEKARSSPDMRAAAMGSEIPVDWLVGDLAQRLPKSFRGRSFNFNDLTADEAALLISLTPGWEDFMHAERMTQGLPTRPSGFSPGRLTETETEQQKHFQALGRMQAALVPEEAP
jgi:hypothetical protein